jgi:predicted phosphohydrolase
MMDEIGKELKLSNDDIETIKFVCKNHMYWWYLKGAKRTKKLELALHKDYDILTEVCFADECSRLYLSSEEHYYQVYNEIDEELQKVKTSQALKDMLSQLVD